MYYALPVTRQSLITRRSHNVTNVTGKLWLVSTIHREGSMMSTGGLVAWHDLIYSELVEWQYVGWNYVPALYVTGMRDECVTPCQNITSKLLNLPSFFLARMPLMELGSAATKF